MQRITGHAGGFFFFHCLCFNVSVVVCAACTAVMYEIFTYKKRILISVKTKPIFVQYANYKQ